MSLHVQLREAIWPCVKMSIDHLREERSKSPSPDIRAGHNFFIVVGSTCFIEGVCETALKELLAHTCCAYFGFDKPDFEQRSLVNRFVHRIRQDLEGKIGRTTGADGYSEMFELVTGLALRQMRQIEPLWEGITALFQFRNVLGHGREVFAELTSLPPRDDLDIPEARPLEIAEAMRWRDEFSGGYKKVEIYLTKRGIPVEKFTDRLHRESDRYTYLSDAIADHFWMLAQQVPRAIADSFDDGQKRVCEVALQALLKDSAPIGRVARP